MADGNARVAIIAAIIGLIGTLGGALIGNWDKLFPPERGAAAPRDVVVPGPDVRTSPAPAPDLAAGTRTATPPSRPEPAAVAAAPVPNITGTWRDVDYPGVVGQVTQTGNSFRFTRVGVLPNGIGFESAGNGVIDATRVSTRFDTRYQTGVLSTGSCTGTVSGDGGRLDLTCTDSLLGTFPVTSARQ
jgi:hypothetical protein